MHTIEYQAAFRDNELEISTAKWLDLKTNVECLKKWDLLHNATYVNVKHTALCHEDMHISPLRC